MFLRLRVCQNITRKAYREKLQIETGDLQLDEEVGEIIISGSGTERTEMLHAPAALILTTKVKVCVTYFFPVCLDATSVGLRFCCCVLEINTTHKSVSV